MKFILSFVGIGIVCLGIFLCGGQTGSTFNEDYMRIHIVANSNSAVDQSIKYVVKDAVVSFLLPQLSEAETKEEAEDVIQQNLQKIEEVANLTLDKQGAKYSAKVEITQEDMPTRAYDDFVLEKGVYDCLKIELGAGDGDNWWCVVFPAVCFLDVKNSENVEYISKIWDIISNVI